MSKVPVPIFGQPRGLYAHQDTEPLAYKFKLPYKCTCKYIHKQENLESQPLLLRLEINLFGNLLRDCHLTSEGIWFAGFRNKSR